VRVQAILTGPVWLALSGWPRMETGSSLSGSAEQGETITLRSRLAAALPCTSLRD
jgi:hypothetical protein